MKYINYIYIYTHSLTFPHDWGLKFTIVSGYFVGIDWLIVGRELKRSSSGTEFWGRTTVLVKGKEKANMDTQ